MWSACWRGYCTGSRVGRSERCDEQPSRLSTARRSRSASTAMVISVQWHAVGASASVLWLQKVWKPSKGPRPAGGGGPLRPRVDVFRGRVTSKLLDIHSPQKQKLQKCTHRDQPSLSFLVCPLHVMFRQNDWLIYRSSSRLAKATFLRKAKHPCAVLSAPVAHISSKS
jgi:hypothetical protein